MKYTLITFQWTADDRKPGGPYPIERAIRGNPGVEIVEGAYLYKTVQECGKIHRLAETLRSLRRPFALLRFESENVELCCFSPEAQAEAINTLGFEVGDLRDSK